MLCKVFGDRNLPTIILLHGGGLSWWSYEQVIERMKGKYHLVVPIIDGHGEDGETTFESIEVVADRLFTYIDANYGGSVFAIGGLSIGAQIVVEVLSRRHDLAKYAMIESALVQPILGTKTLVAPMLGAAYGLMGYRWFAKAQAKSLFVPEQYFERYYEDSLKMSKASLRNITVSNGTYRMKACLKETQAKVIVIVGEKELGIMKKSAQELHDAIPNSELYVAKGMGHGELSLCQSKQYVALMEELFASHSSRMVF